jgi:hypothetical protein
MPSPMKSRACRLLNALISSNVIARVPARSSTQSPELPQWCVVKPGGEGDVAVAAAVGGHDTECGMQASANAMVTTAV